MSMQRQALGALVLMGAVMSLVGCAQQVGDIDRTQPNKLRKEIFNSEDEWFTMSTVVETNSTAVTSFAGLQGEMARVRWEVNENVLLAYRTNEDVVGIDTHLNNPESEANGLFEGRPVAAFPIQSHFDVQRQYNSATGEQSNVITENGSDRPWYEREWFRVDWSRNVAPVLDLDPAVQMQTVSSLQVDPQDAGLTPEDITWRVEYNDDGEATYLEVVNYYVVEPSFVDCILTFGFPLYGGDCGPETVKVRTSFMKAPKGVSQHEPREYNDNDMDKFGFFRTERCVYDRNYGCRDSSTVKLANTWRIWDNARNEDGTFKPYADRTPRPVVYYYTPDFPNDLKLPSEEIAKQWSEAFAGVVKHYQPDFDGKMFYVCENPGRADDPGYAEGYCKNPGVTKQLGDLRYSFFSWVDNPQQTGPLGYGPSAADPLTGEIIVGNANLYGAAIDTYVNYTLDILRLVNGDLDLDAFKDGKNLEDYFAELREQGLFYGYDKYKTDRSESLANLKEKINLREGRVFELRDSVKGLPPEARMDMLHETANFGQASWEKLRGSEIEQLMLVDEIEHAVGEGPVGVREALGENVSEEERLDLMSPARIGTKKYVMGDENNRLYRFLSRNITMAEFYDTSYLGFAMQLKDLMENEWTGSYDEKLAQARVWMRQQLYRAVMSHEVGHTLGLRHNFEGSFDAMNFFPEYWENRFVDRDNDGQVDMIDPNEPLTEAQLKANIRGYQYSTVMDYGARLTADLFGLGSYDRAAIAYGYGNLREVFNDAPKKINVDYANSEWDGVTPSNDPITDWNDIDNVDGATGGDGVTPVNDFPYDEDNGRLDNDLNFYHYAVLPYLFDGTDGDMGKMYKRHFVNEDELNSEVVVPYRFCSDEYRGAKPSCNVYDEGPAFDEIMDNYVRLYEQYYFHNNFRRDRAGWGLWLWPTISRFLTRYFEPIVGIYQHWVIRLFNYDDEWYVSEWGGRLGWAGIERGIGTILNTFVTPHPGSYSYDNDLDMWVNVATDMPCAAGQETSEESPCFKFGPGDKPRNFGDSMGIPLGVGKYDFSRFDPDGGYYYFLRDEVLGTFFERWMAMLSLTDPTTNFIGVDSSSDVTQFSIPVTLLYGDEMYRWFGATINSDLGEIGPLAEADEDGKMQVKMQNPLASASLRGSYANKEKINPYSSVYGNRSFNMELFAMVYGLSWFQDRFDRSFNSQASVLVLGRGESYELPEGWQTVEWTDPQTGITYAAARSEYDAERGTYPTGWNMVQKAKDLEAKWREVSCERNATDLSDCELVNGEYFEMSSQREMLDVLAATHGVLYNWNVPVWALQ